LTRLVINEDHSMGVTFKNTSYKVLIQVSLTRRDLSSFPTICQPFHSECFYILFFYP